MRKIYQLESISPKTSQNLYKKIWYILQNKYMNSYLKLETNMSRQGRSLTPPKSTDR